MPDRPRFTPDEASEISARQFGVAGVAYELPSERDRNFRITSADGAVHVLKIAPSVEEPSTLEGQNAALRWIRTHAPELGVPKVVGSRQGHDLERIEDHEGTSHLVRLLTYLPGVPLAEVRPKGRSLLHGLGRFLGEMNRALTGFSHRGTRQDLPWHPDRGLEVIENGLPCLPEPAQQDLLRELHGSLRVRLGPRLPDLRRSVVHNDANDHNVLVDCHLEGDRIAGLIDFGDLMEAPTVADVSTAAAYAMLDQPDPTAAARWLLTGFHEVFPLQEAEVEVFFDLARLRLGMSAAIAARQRLVEPDNEYLTISQRAVWSLLETLRSVDPGWQVLRARHSCGLPATRHGDRLRAWLEQAGRRARPVFGDTHYQVLDLSVRSPDLAMLEQPVSMGDLSGLLERTLHLASGSSTAPSTAGAAPLERQRRPVGIGRYAEPRLLYSGDHFQEQGQARTVHLGVDLFAPAGTPVRAPCAGQVHSFGVNEAPLDYGPTLILEHEPEDGPRFFTLYGHLAPEALVGLEVGQAMEAGAVIAALGSSKVNGGWPSHLHFQVIAEVGQYRGDFPGVAPPDEASFWLDLCPSPHVLLGLPEETVAGTGPTPATLLDQRRRTLGPSLSLSYRQPLEIVCGRGQFLFDSLGRRYLDAVNNVPHVGHCHPHVVRAAARQAAVLNTNTRYLHECIVDYTRRLSDLLPEPLRVCFLTCSGSEANELALRMARTHTGRRDVLVLEAAYHGNTSALVDLSPYKHDGPGGAGAPPWVHVLDRPDPYRGRHRGPDTGAAYVADARRHVEELGTRGAQPAAVFAEPLMGCGGQLVPPTGYLAGLFQVVREAGGLCVADEVQVGFGRVGEHMWAFELHDVVPDIVTLGKPIGNGHPLAAVITTEEIARSFDNGMEYFNTFGGNPVSCAVGQAVLNVLEHEELQENARVVGAHLRRSLTLLATHHPLIGDVRGHGLVLGVELVLDRESRTPAADHASAVVERMKARGVLLSTDGPDHNVLKIKPPLVFTAKDADTLSEHLDDVLGETALCSRR